MTKNLDDFDSVVAAAARLGSHDDQIDVAVLNGNFTAQNIAEGN